MTPLLKRFLKAIAYSLGVLCLLGILVGLSIPTLLSTKWGNRRLLDAVNERIQGEISVDRISLSWFGPQKLEGFQFTGQDGNAILSVESFQTGIPLHSLLGPGLMSGTEQTKSLLAIAQSVLAGKTNAHIKNFPVHLLDNYLAHLQPGFEGILGHIIGDTIDLRLTETAGGGSSLWAVDVESANVRLSCCGSLEKNVFRLGGPAVVKVRIDLQAADDISHLLPSLKDWRLTTESDLSVEVAEMQVPLAFFDDESFSPAKDQLSIHAKVSLPNMGFTNRTDKSLRKRLRDFYLNVDSLEEASSLEISSGGYYSHDHTPISYRLETKIPKPRVFYQLITSLLQPTELVFSVDSVPTNTVETALHAEGALERVLGNTVSFRMESNAKEPRLLRMSLMSDKLDVPSIQLSVDKNGARLGGSAVGNWSGSLIIDKIVFTNAPGKPYVHGVQLPWEISKGYHDFRLGFSGKTVLPNHDQGQFSGRIELDSFGALKDSRILLELQGNAIPAPLLELVTGREEVVEVFGHAKAVSLSADLNRFEGGVKASLKGMKGDLSLNGYIAQEQLYLKEPLVFSTYITKELQEGYLGYKVPLLRELVSAEGPFSMSISPKNFVCPIDPFYLDGLQIEEGSIAVGKMIFANAGEVRELVARVRPVQSDYLSVWPTPLYFSFRQGQLHARRVDMLLMERYPVAAWGTIDFAKSQVNMLLGVTGIALANALESGGYDKSIVLQIPVKGSLSNPKIDSSKVTRKVASLLAHQSGGPEGYLIGTVLDLTTGKEQKVPPPTTQPFPWESYEHYRFESTGSKEVHPKQNPLSEIDKGAKNVLKSLFQ